MYNEKVTLTRLERFRDELEKLRFPQKSPLKAEYIYNQSAPIPYGKELAANHKEYRTDRENAYQFKDIATGEEWGKTWGSAWFRFFGTIPAEWQDEEVGALIDLEGEGCVFIDGTPWQGLTNKIHWSPASAKRLVILPKKVTAQEDVFLLVEAAANGLFGAGQEFYRLQQAELCTIDRKAWQLYFDLETIISLIQALPEKSPRRRKLLYNTNEAVNLFAEGNGMDEALQITCELLAKPACASTMTAYSIGHAHLDLAWLWRLQETRRKGGRTFATALRMMDEYPDYKFGASQPQLYEWIKEDYPALFEQVKERISQGRWECQGAMWVEPDMNIPSGESLVRQLLYGKKFWQSEFDLDIKNLWLPDVFGYSAALPQILVKSGVNTFMTQKISWNETNTFPHHSFFWEGIDGTRIPTHFLPTNDYNCSNLPKQLLEAQERFAQSDVANEFLNLFGIGDGGGGPGRVHIELAKRQRNTEGAVKVKMDCAHKFFKTLNAIPEEMLPVWKGELYLELHRGTYTTQAKMKKYNRTFEHELHNTEFLAVLANDFNKKLIDNIWKNTLLFQFHDILPGSSIKEVYEDVHLINQHNQLILNTEKQRLLNKFSTTAKDNDSQWHYIIYNTLSWQRSDTVLLELPDDSGNWLAMDAKDKQLPAVIYENMMQVMVTAPCCGYTSIKLVKTENYTSNGKPLAATTTKLENELLRIQLDENGTIISMIDKTMNKEMLMAPSNVLLLFEDKPNNWDAWDINHYYRETQPEQAKLIDSEVILANELLAVLQLEFTIGKSAVTQYITIKKDSKLVEISTSVNWKESRKLLKMRAIPDIRAHEAAFEIQYGYINRPTHNNTSWDQAKFEVCAHRFADISQSDCGFALINDCKYGHYVKDNTMELTLLRSPRNPDTTADIGNHTFSYAFLPHQDVLTSSAVLPEAHGFNSELIVHKVTELPQKRDLAMFSIEGKNVKLETIKPAENGKGVILRLYEYYGTNTGIVLKASEKWSQLIETDLMENDLHLDSKNTAQTQLDFEPFEIRTFRLVH